IIVGNGSGNSVTILYGCANNSFSAAQPIPVDGAVTFMTVTDLDKDSFPDIAAGSSGTNKISIFFRDPTNPDVDTVCTPPVSKSRFRASTPFSVGVAPSAMATGDFDRNGSPDLAITSGGSDGKLTILLNQPPGTFTQKTQVVAGARPSAVAIDQS